MTAICLDTETTQIDEPEVIELAWAQVELPNVTGAIRGEHHRFQPVKPAQFGAVAVHHILPADLEGMPPAATAPRRVPPAHYWVGHNIDFDWKALGSPPGPKRICTLALARAQWPELDSHSLGAVLYYLRGTTAETRTALRSAHSAVHDVEFCLHILDAVVKAKGLVTWEQVYAASEDARVPRTWTFGKFKGQPIGAADRGYANWYRRLADADPYVIEALRRAGLV